jgi:hypothetical protein
MPDFQIFRADRVAKKGGVAIIVKSIYSAVRIESIQPPDALHDLVCVDLHANHMRFRLICIYRPPGDIESGRADALLLVTRLNKLLVKNRIIFLLGDFNLPNVNWNNLSYPSDGIHDSLINLCLLYNMEQLVREPTRYDAILDLLFYDPNVVTNCFIAPPLGSGDHNIVLFSAIGLVASGEKIRNKIVNCIATWNTEAIAKAEHFFYSFNWNSVFIYSFHPEDLWLGFKDVLLHCVNSFAKK